MIKDIGIDICRVFMHMNGRILPNFSNSICKQKQFVIIHICGYAHMINQTY